MAKSVGISRQQLHDPEIHKAIDHHFFGATTPRLPTKQAMPSDATSTVVPPSRTDSGSLNPFGASKPGSVGAQMTGTAGAAVGSAGALAGTSGALAAGATGAGALAAGALAGPVAGAAAADAGISAARDIYHATDTTQSHRNAAFARQRPVEE